MDYFEDDQRLFELSVLAEAQSDDLAVECFEMSADGAGLVGVLRVSAEGRGQLELHGPITVQLLRRWLQVAESEAGLA